MISTWLRVIEGIKNISISEYLGVEKIPKKLGILTNYFFSFICKILFKLNISDILYTYVLGNTSKTINLSLKQKDFTFCVELPIKAKINELKIVSSACYERRRIGGKKKVNEFHDGFLILIHILKLFLKYKRP